MNFLLRLLRLRSRNDEWKGKKPMRHCDQPQSNQGKNIAKSKVTIAISSRYLKSVSMLTLKNVWFISTPRLNTLRCLHLEPINPLISGKSKSSHLGVGFALICFQRLSVPNVATQQCSWRNNWYTRGWFIPVLSSRYNSRITTCVDYILTLPIFRIGSRHLIEDFTLYFGTKASVVTGSNLKCVTNLLWFSFSWWRNYCFG